jgi:dephospho-CoA kinase
VLKIALTGGIATGKSYVAARLREAGVPVVDADRLARDAVAPGTPGLDQVRARFGDEAISPDGTLDRKRVAALVFTDAEARRDLEAIVHPVVRAAVDAFFASLPPDTPFAVADIPLLYETGQQRRFDAVIVAACPPELQVERVMRRDGASREDAERRIAAQLPIEDKAARAEFVIRTSGTAEETDRQIKALLSALAAPEAQNQNP